MNWKHSGRLRIALTLSTEMLFVRKHKQAVKVYRGFIRKKPTGQARSQFDPQISFRSSSPLLGRSIGRNGLRRFPSNSIDVVRAYFGISNEFSASPDWLKSSSENILVDDSDLRIRSISGESSFRLSFALCPPLSSI